MKNKTALVCSAALCLALLPVKPVEAGVKVQTKTTYYPIKGRDGKALNASMLRGGGDRIRLNHAIAATESEIEFGEPKIVVKNGRCVVEDVDVILKIRYIYPKWVDRNKASREVRKRWDAFWRELKRHEENHGAIALAGAKSLEKELKKMHGSVAIACANFGSMAGIRLKNVIRKTAVAQRNFDRREYAASSKISKLQRQLYEAK